MKETPLYIIFCALCAIAIPRIAYVYALLMKEWQLQIHITIRTSKYRHKTVHINSYLIVGSVIAITFVTAFLGGNGVIGMRNIASEQLETNESNEYRSLYLTQADQLDSASKLISKQDELYRQLEQKYTSLAQSINAVAKKVGVSTKSLHTPTSVDVKTQELTTSRSMSTIANSVVKTAGVIDAMASEQEKEVQVLTLAIEQKEAIAKAIPTLWPLYGIITSKFGNREDPFGTGATEFHTGVDISAPYGTPVRATASGTVTLSGTNGNYGLCVIIDHGNGIRTLYAHMCKLSVEQGAKIARGSVLGFEGSTGRSTGAHCHYEVIVNGTPVNPLTYMN